MNCMGAYKHQLYTTKMKMKNQKNMNSFKMKDEYTRKDFQL